MSTFVVRRPAFKATRVAYWTSTGLLALFILPGALYLSDPFALEGTRRLGLPAWLHYEVGIAQPLAALLILLPFVPARLKEWAYVGLGLVYLSALVAHAAVDGLTGMVFAPLLPLAVLLISYRSHEKLQQERRSSFA